MIQLAQISEIDSLIKLSQKSFGIGFHSINYFKNIISSNINKCYIYRENKSIIGFCTAIQEQDGVVRLDSICVDEGSREKGIATMLIEELLFDFPSKEIITYVWNESANKGMPDLCTRLGFIKTETILNYWLNDSLERGYSCIVCGNPCKCSVDVYKK